MSTRVERTAATRARILDAVRDLVREGGFHDASMETIAARAGVTRVTLYRVFGSKRDLLEGLAWDALSQARLDRVDAAHANPDVRAAVGEVLQANCEMFAQLAEGMPLSLELARYDSDMRAVIDATFHGRRHAAMDRLAVRIVREGAAAPGWTVERIADAMLALTSYEPYETLIQRRGHSVDEAGELLHRLARAFLAN